MPFRASFGKTTITKDTLFQKAPSYCLIPGASGTVLEDTILIPENNSRAILHDEKLYPDPSAFKPERFLKDGRIDASVQDPEAAAFGYGRRIWYVLVICASHFRFNLLPSSPGKSMGLDAVWLTAASILAAFDIKKMASPDGPCTEPKFKAVGITW